MNIHQQLLNYFTGVWARGWLLGAGCWPLGAGVLSYNSGRIKKTQNIASLVMLPPMIN